MYSLKRKLFLVFLLCISISVVYLTKITPKNMTATQHVDTPPVPYNPRKINTKGEYQPFYGYTIVAMIDTEQRETAVQLENFLRNSTLARTYSPLPASSYHMTIYTIYECGSKMIPPVRKWSEDNGITISKQNWLPEEVLHEQHTRATCILHKYLSEPLRIKSTTLDIGERVIKLNLIAEDESLDRIRIVRDKLKLVYQHPDMSMEPIDERLHITLAYVYAPQTANDEMDKLNLRQLAEPFNGAKLLLPSVCLFDSMKRFIPFVNTTEVEC